MSMDQRYAHPDQTTINIDSELHILINVLRLANNYLSDDNSYSNNLQFAKDEDGWVSILFVAGMEEIRKITSNIWLIMQALESSEILEVKDDKVRRRRLNDSPMMDMSGTSNQDTLIMKVAFMFDYYFSDENLKKDISLVNEMNEEGWIHILVIADFEQVKSISTDLSVILEGVASSTKIELKNNKIRRLNDWYIWLPERFRKKDEKVKKIWTWFTRSKSKEFSSTHGSKRYGDVRRTRRNLKSCTD